MNMNLRTRHAMEHIGESYVQCHSKCEPMPIVGTCSKSLVTELRALLTLVHLKSCSSRSYDLF